MKKSYFLYVSTHAGSEGSGIYCCRFDILDGRLSDFRKVADLERAGLMVLHPLRNLLYVVGVEGTVGDNQGCIDAYAIDADTATLDLRGRQLTGAGLPTFITISEDGSFLFQASFSTAAASVLTISADGSLIPSGKVHRFEGTGVNPIRQTKSHPHCINIHPTDQTVFVSDLGTDVITRFRLDKAHGDLIRQNPPQMSIRLGAGPRIMRFSNNGRHIYIVNELDNTIAVYQYNDSEKSLEAVQVISTLPDQIEATFETQMASEIRLHPNQQYVYVTNRSNGEGTVDGITVFKRDEISGAVSPVEYLSTGIHPRHFNIDPTGQWLFVSARDSDQIHRFRIDQITGQLKEIEHPVNFPQPWDIQFYID